MGKNILYIKKRGFTIVELLVVIVVIGILAAITIVAYTGVSQKAIAASLQSDLDGAKKQLEIYKVQNESYPGSINYCPIPTSGNLCLKTSSGNSFTYRLNTPTSYTLSVKNTNNSVPAIFTDGSATQELADCSSLTGFIVVPGSTTYNQPSFCVMKYEARRIGPSTVPVSQSFGGSIFITTQQNAINYSRTVANCTSCHLMKESEWLTIAQNVMSVASNWSGGSVGSGYIYSGHNDGSPSSPQDADGSDDGNGYIYTGNDISNGKSQRRTLMLSNGQIIWDLAGNISEWVDATIANGQQPGLSSDVDYSYKEWNDNNFVINGFPSSSMPSYANPAASGWTSANGIGQLYSFKNGTSVHAYERGGSYGSGARAGIFYLNLFLTPSDDFNVGFRVAR